MALNARQLLEDSLQKIKTDDNQAKFWENKQNSEKFDSETSELQPVNLSETSNAASVHQRVTDSLQSFLCFFLLSQPDPSSVMTHWFMGCSVQDV